MELDCPCPKKWEALLMTSYLCLRLRFWSWFSLFFSWWLGYYIKGSGLRRKLAFTYFLQFSPNVLNSSSKRPIWLTGLINILSLAKEKQKKIERHTIGRSVIMWTRGAYRRQ
jgi:hypothetical protein